MVNKRKTYPLAYARGSVVWQARIGMGLASDVLSRHKAGSERWTLSDPTMQRSNDYGTYVLTTERILSAMI